MRLMIIAMGDNLIGRALDEVGQRISDKFEWLFDPIWGTIFWIVVISAVCFFIAFFAPFKWVKAVMGFIVALAVAFGAGAWQARKTYKERLEDERTKRREAEARARERRDSNGGGGGGGFFDFWRRDG